MAGFEKFCLFGVSYYIINYQFESSPFVLLRIVMNIHVLLTLDEDYINVFSVITSIIN